MRRCSLANCTMGLVGNRLAILAAVGGCDGALYDAPQCEHCTQRSVRQSAAELEAVMNAVPSDILVPHDSLSGENTFTRTRRANRTRVCLFTNCADGTPLPPGELSGFAVFSLSNCCFETHSCFSVTTSRDVRFRHVMLQQGAVEHPRKQSAKHWSNPE